MLTHTIAPYTSPPPKQHGNVTQKFLEKYTGGEFGDEKHKQFIHQRALSMCKFTEGEKVRYKNKPAIIEHICDDFKGVGWTDLTCHYIMISQDDGAAYEMVHHSSLTRMGK